MTGPDRTELVRRVRDLYPDIDFITFRYTNCHGRRFFAWASIHSHLGLHIMGKEVQPETFGRWYKDVSDVEYHLLH